MSERIRVLVVDDHLMFGDAVEALLASKDDIEVCAVVPSAEQGIEKCRADPPDVVLMDLDLPGMDGIRATRSITEEHPECKVVVVSAFANTETVAQSVEAGAIGYVPKLDAADRLVHAVRSAVAGDIVLPQPEVLEALAARTEARRAAQDGRMIGQLTRREIEVLQLLAEGKGLQETAAELGLSRFTVRDYLTMAMGRLGARSRLEAVLVAVRHGLVEIQSQSD